MTKPKRITNRELAQAVADRIDFRGNSTQGMRLEPGARWIGRGRLPSEWSERLTADVEGDGVAYVVFSYSTPIAWVTGKGEAVIPDVKYSVTTSMAQSRVRLGLSGWLVPSDFEVKPLEWNAPAQDRATCGTCHRSWDDAVVTSMTPAPSGRCPFEAFHLPD